MRSTWLKRLKLRLILAGFYDLSLTKGLRRFKRGLKKLLLMIGDVELWAFRKSGLFCLLQKYDGECPSCAFCVECYEEAKKELGPIRKVA